MERLAGHVVQLWVRPRAPIWCVGTGWAALCGAIASGILWEDGTSWLTRIATISLIWLLADPVLGTLWELGTMPDGVWRQLWRATGSADDNLAPILLPYTQPGSPAWRLANWLGRQSAWWRAVFWPQNAEAFITICGLFPVALIVGALLNRAVPILICMQVVLAWLIALWCRELPSSKSDHPWRVRTANAWGQFGIPWMIGFAASGEPQWPGVALGICMTFSYMGLLREPIWQPGVLAGQLAAFVIVLGTRQLLALSGVAVLLIVEGGLWLAKGLNDNPDARLLTGVHLLVLGVMLIASFAVGLG